MPPKNDTPPISDEFLAAISDNLVKLITATNTNTDRILETQNIIARQLAQQSEIITTTPPATPPPTAPTPPTAAQPTSPKISVPPFDGSNPLDWLFQADQYLTFYNIQHPQRLTMISTKKKKKETGN